MKTDFPIKRRAEWVGDAALMFLVRRELALRYPKLGPQDLMVRERELITNQALHQFAKGKALEGYQNVVERNLAWKIENNFDAATVWVRELVNMSKAVKRIDAAQLDADGSVKEEHKLQRQLALKKKQLLADVFEKNSKKVRFNPEDPELQLQIRRLKIARRVLKDAQQKIFQIKYRNLETIAKETT